jgi:hypothetical protein
MLDEIIAYAFPPTLEEGEFTRRQIYDEAQERGRPVGYNIVSRRLDAMVSDGLLTRRKVIHRGKEQWAYRPTEEWERAKAQQAEAEEREAG